MLRGLLYFLKLSLYWLVFFTLYRLVFILIHPGLIPEGKTGEALRSFFYGFRLDISTIAYMISLPVILWSIQQFFKHNSLNRIHHIYNLVMISAVSLLCVSNLSIYGEWNALINYNTLHYLLKPAKMFPYLTTFELVSSGAGIAVLIAIFVLLFRVMILMVLPYSTAPIKRKLFLVPLVFPVLFIVMRGGIQAKPINETASCYSDIKFIDHVSINPVWHLGRMTVLAMQQPEEENQVRNKQ